MEREGGLIGKKFIQFEMGEVCGGNVPTEKVKSFFELANRVKTTFGW